jgi:hypothetical protein
MPEVLRIARAIATNQLARFFPSLYVRATRQTGRGARESETPDEIAAYFRRCVDDYFAVLGIAPADVPAFLRGKTVLEYGPGDFPGVAVLLVAMGAEKVYCADRFPLITVTDKNVRVLDRLLAGLAEPARVRISRSFMQPGAAGSGFLPSRIEYLLRPSGLSGLEGIIDLVISRAVLEHVDDLPATFHDMVRAMRPGAVSIHQVDLKSHGLHRQNPLDFLSRSPRLWSLMYSHKGVPNRWRVDRYRTILRSLPVDIVKLEPTLLAPAKDVADVRHSLAGPFAQLSDDDLACLGFWLVFSKPAG